MSRLQLKPMRRSTSSQAIPITFAYTHKGDSVVNSAFRFLWAVLAFCTFAASSSIHRAGAEDVAASVGPDVEKYNIVWDSLSEKSALGLGREALSARSLRARFSHQWHPCRDTALP
jgi:hypothetical protein